ncbi:50S ribosomal protein L30 [Corynebacterium halotolerans]|uniref:50S ribosomal protein L30 n=1 Tax=Corynebacterium halotolerans TaxID=225326 RepID=UPI003CF7166D
MALKITQKKSNIGVKPMHRSNLQSLGLRRIGHSVVRPDTAAVRGQINVVRHLVVVEEVAGE